MGGSESRVPELPAPAAFAALPFPDAPPSPPVTISSPVPAALPPPLAPAALPAGPLAAMLAAAPRGAVVRIPPGVYRERLAITKPVVLVPRDGAGSVTVELPAVCPVLADAEIRDLIFTGAGVGVGSAAVLRLSGCSITAVRTTGLSVRDRGRLLARDVRITGTTGNGLHLGSLAVAVLEHCRIADTAFSAVHLAGQARLDLEDCEIRGSAEHGVRVTEQASLRIDGGRVVESGMSGVSTETSGRVVLAGCEVRGAERAGIVVGTGTTARIERCTVAAVSGSGVVVWKDATAQLIGGSIVGTGKNGLYIADDAHGVFEDCEIRETAFPALHVGKRADPLLRGLRIPEANQNTPEVLAGPESFADTPIAAEARAAVQAAAPVAAASLEDLLAELDGLAGLDAVKSDINSLVNMMRLAQRRTEAGLPPPPITRHLLFEGNADTGKSTVARLYARVLHSLGVIERDGFATADGAALAADTADATVAKTTAVFQGAIGGVLYLDEPYTLLDDDGDANDGVGREAISTLAELLLEHRHAIIVLAAGQPAGLRRFLDSDPRLAAIFTRTLIFEDYEADVLADLVRRHAERLKYEFGPDTTRALAEYFEAGDEVWRTEDKGRVIWRVFEALAERHAQRVAKLAEPSTEALVTMLPRDVPEPESWTDS